MKTRHSLITFTAVLLLFALISPSLAVTANAKEYSLRFWSIGPETHWAAEPFKRFIADVKEKTNGMVIITPYWSESLAPAKEVLGALKSGLVDIGQFMPFYSPGEFPVSEITGLPFQAKSLKGITEGLHKLYDEGLMPEYSGKGFQLLDFQAPGMQTLLFKDKKVDTLEKFKGLKIRSQSSITVEMLKLFGATPVAMAGTDLYMSLDRGVLDGTLSSPGFAAPFKLYEVVKFCVDEPLYGGNLFVGMNQQKWDSLPADLQDIFMQCVRAFTDDWRGISLASEERGKRTLIEKGVTFYKFKPGELEKLKTVTQPIIDKFIKDMNSLGLQGQKIVDTFQAAQTGY